MSEHDKRVLPVVHLNGTSRESLIADYERAHNALRSFVTAFARIEFNARDYYPLGQKAFCYAAEWRAQTFLGIGEMEQYLGAHLESLYDETREPLPVKIPTELTNPAPRSWPEDRKRELAVLEKLLREVTLIDHGSGALERIRDVMIMAEELTESDMREPRKSFVQFLAEQANPLPATESGGASGS